MANITAPEAVNFCNNEVRRVNDMSVALYWTYKKILADFTSKGLSTTFVINGDIVVDGAATDGRHQMTTFDVNALLSRATAYVTDFEATTNLKLNQASVIAVNTNPLF